LGSAKGVLFLLTASALWGAIGVIVELLIASPSEVVPAVTIRSLSATLVLLPFVKRVLRRDAVLMGLISATFYTTYVVTIALEGISVPAVMLYTAPAFILALYVLEGRKVKAYDVMLVIPVVIGVLLLYGGQILSFATLLGLATGLTYGLLIWYSSLMQSRKYSEWEVIQAQSLWSLPPLATASLAFPHLNLSVLVGGVLLGVLETVVAYYFFYKGMRFVGPFYSTVISSTEPVFAMVYALLVFGQRLNGLQYLGAALILLSSILAAARTRK